MLCIGKCRCKRYIYCNHTYAHTCGTESWYMVIMIESEMIMSTYLKQMIGWKLPSQGLLCTYVILSYFFAYLFTYYILIAYVIQDGYVLCDDYSIFFLTENPAEKRFEEYFYVGSLNTIIDMIQFIWKFS